MRELIVLLLLRPREGVSCANEESEFQLVLLIWRSDCQSPTL